MIETIEITEEEKLEALELGYMIEEELKKQFMDKIKGSLK
jgi:hypothetical protein